MQKKLLLSYLVMIVVTMLITIAITWNRVDEHFIQQVAHESETNLILVKTMLESNDEMAEVYMDEFVREIDQKAGFRVTIIDYNGIVLAESRMDKEQMDNHQNREEIREAIDTGEMSSSIRFSQTVGTYMNYVAVPIKIEGQQYILRISTPISEIDGLINDVIKFVSLGLLFSAGLAFLLAYIVTTRFMTPVKELTKAAGRIADGHYEEKIYIDQTDEVGELADAFNAMTFTLRLNLWEIEQKNSELESIISSMDNGILVVDTEFKITLYNNRFIELFDVKEHDLEGKPFYEATRSKMVFDVLEKAFDQSGLEVKETRVQTESGERLFNLSAMPIRSNKISDQVLGTLLMVQDITQLRKLETMRSDFVSNVTHELKTPLTSIRGFVDTLKNGAINEEVSYKFLDIIDIESERLEILISDILTLSEIEAMIGEKSQGDYLLSEIGAEVVQLLHKKADKKGLSLIADFQEDLPLYVCNRNRIKQLLINLTDNALKYTETGHVKLSIRQEYSQLVIEVEDTGIGIEKKHIPRLFERFYRVDKGRSRKMGGTGLGLSIVKHITELYHGRIKVTSEIDKGTTMTIYLPM